MWHTLISALLGATSVHALVARQNIAPLFTSQIDAFTPYSYYAAAAYCRPAKSINWDCGGTSASCVACPTPGDHCAAHTHMSQLIATLTQDLNRLLLAVMAILFRTVSLLHASHLHMERRGCQGMLGTM